MSIIAERSASSRIIFDHGECDSAEDLRDASASELETLRIEIKDPNMTVWLQRGCANIETVEPKRSGKELAAAIAAYLRERERSLISLVVVCLGWLLPWAVLFSAIGLLTVAYLNSLQPGQVWAFQVVVPSSILGAIACAIVNAMAIRNKGDAVVYPWRNSEGQRMSRASRSAMLVGVASAFATAGLTALTAYLVP